MINFETIYIMLFIKCTQSLNRYRNVDKSNELDESGAELIRG